MIFKKLLNKNKVKEIAEQRKVLTETFPYTDWKKVPYTQYNKFLSLKDLIGECGVVWTNAFGRSNTEAEDTRKYLKDYSKHYEYVQDFSTFSPIEGIPATITKTSISITNTQESGTWIIGTAISNYVNQEWKVYVESDNDISNLSFQFHVNQSNTVTVLLQKGINTIPIQTFTNQTRVVISVPVGVSVTLTQIPNEVANERDIELFNFEYANNSGYGMFRDNCLFGLHASIDTFVDYTYSANTIHVTNIKTVGAKYLYVRNINSSAIGTTFKGRIRIEGIDSIRANDPTAFCQVAYSGSSASSPILGITGDGIFDWNYTKEDDSTIWITVLIYTSAEDLSTVSLYIEQIPDIDGCIVSDGVDDYGQCVKDFALPDDYTVVAMRELIDHKAPLIAKSIKDGNMSFVFEYTNGCYSYGSKLETTNFPKLFSYMTKTSYNGSNITPGDRQDSESAKLQIFAEQGDTIYEFSALYSFGIFTRTLTEEELRIVENCMYAEWIAMTGMLEDIEYYDILDARFRSNEEDADKRNKWVGRLGKLHMTLNNYGFTQMSGWGGWPLDLNNFESGNEIIEKSGSKLKIRITQPANNWIAITYNDLLVSNTARIRAIIDKKDQASKLYLTWTNASNDQSQSFPLSEGVNEVSRPEVSFDVAATAIDFRNCNSGDEITIELLPDYGGALVSDGVDDYAVSDEVIDEEIGGFVCHAEILPSNTGYIFSTNWKSDGVFEYSTLANLIAGDVVSGNGQVDTRNQALDSILTVFSRVPASPKNRLFIGTINETLQQMGKFALYQLRLIKTQPTETQLEVIKHQVLREHNDYVKEMGWE